MWILVFFDLPSVTKKEQKAASLFRKELLDDGFTMFQFSIYLRFCNSRENATVHIERVKNHLPQYGKVSILHVTGRQFAMMEMFYGRKKAEPKKNSSQLELF